MPKMSHFARRLSGQGERSAYDPRGYKPSRWAKSHRGYRYAKGSRYSYAGLKPRRLFKSRSVRRVGWKSRFSAMREVNAGLPEQFSQRPRAYKANNPYAWQTREGRARMRRGCR